MQSKLTAHSNNLDWPADGLESMPNCPVCGVDARELLYEGLNDKVFFCAMGKWDMYLCKSCATAYLDPRPTQETIELAYRHYYTHDVASDFSSLSHFQKLRRRLANGYRNYRYGTQDFPASILGILAANLMTNGRASIDAGMRHLPKENSNKRLLDMGCGSGAFLLRARSAGLEVVGVDFDQKAVEVARSQNLDVRLGGTEELDKIEGQFDVITLAHFIEHTHHPVEVLKACYRLLKPKGYLWIDTPNISSEGHRLFAESWRGLEPPRHLVLFNLKSISKALATAGFAEVRVQPYRPLCNHVFRASMAISECIDPYSEPSPSVPVDLVRKAELIARSNPEHREFITVKAWKK